MTEQEWKSKLKSSERDEEVLPSMVWRSADGTIWSVPSSEQKREPILLWPDGQTKRLMELGSDQLLALANAFRDSGNRRIQGSCKPEDHKQRRDV